MTELMAKGWRFEMFQNELGTYTAIARKGKVEVTADDFSWWAMIASIVEKTEGAEKENR